ASPRTRESLIHQLLACRHLAALKRPAVAPSTLLTRGYDRPVMPRSALGALWQGEPQTSGHYGAEYSSVGLIGGSGVGFMPPSCGNLAEGAAHFSWRRRASALSGAVLR